MFEAEELIKQAIERHKGHIAIACSFGKASTLVLHMALKYNPNIKVVFCNTLCQPKETYDYRDLLVKKWNLNLTETKPYKGINFWKCTEKYGLPKIRKKGGKGANAPRCCWYLKEKPAEIYYKESKTKAVITGLMKNENQNRLLLAMRYDNSKEVEFCAQRYYMKTLDLWKYHPIMYWTDKQIWRYFKKNKIPINQFYVKWNGLYKRNGCEPCTAYLDWKNKLSISHPKLLTKLLHIDGQKQLEV